MNQLELLKYIWKNRHKYYLFKVKVMRISSNNTSRELCIYIVKANRMINLNSLVARLSIDKHVSLKKRQSLCARLWNGYGIVCVSTFFGWYSTNIKAVKNYSKNRAWLLLRQCRAI